MSRKGGVSSNTHSQQQMDDYANKNNPNNEEFQADLDNHSQQLDPNNDKFQGTDDK